jgi:hypothetical protein
MKPAPAFQCYASNIIADKRYRLMSPAERFVWVSIYLECWPNRAVPADPVRLAKYLGFTVEEVKAGLTDRVLSFFREEKGELVSPELEEYRATLVHRNMLKSKGGKEGAKRKRDNASRDKGIPEGYPPGEPEGSLIQFKPNKSNPTQSIEKGIIPVVGSGVDPWVSDYDKYCKAPRGD